MVMSSPRAYHSLIVRLGVIPFVLALSLVTPGLAAGASWSAGGSLSAAWSGRWPQLDLRGRGGLLLRGGHELGFSAGLLTHRLASQLLYQATYTHTWIGGRRWPLISLWAGGATDVLSYVAQTRAVLGLSLGLRVPIGRRAALRVDLGHELLLGALPLDRTFLALGLEILGGPGWRQGARPCYPARRRRLGGGARREPR